MAVLGSVALWLGASAETAATVSTIGGVAAGAAAVAGGVSAVMSAQQQRRAASQARAMADANFALQTQQMQQQKALAEAQASQNASLLEYQANLQNRNALVLKQQAATVLNQYGIAATAERKTGVSNVQAERENARRFLALQKAKIGESGTTGAGTPLDALADAAGTLELHAQELWHSHEVEARRLDDIGAAQAYDLRGQSTNEGFKAGMTLFQAANERWSGRTAEARFRLGMYGAELNRQEGYNTAKGYKMASYGTLLSGIASFGSAANKLYPTGSGGGTGNLTGGHLISDQSSFGY